MPGVYKNRPKITSARRGPESLEADTSSRKSGLKTEDAVTVDALRDMLMSGGIVGGMNVAIGSLIVEKDLWTEAMELVMSDNDRTAFRASWALEWAYVADMERFAEFIPHFFEDYLRAYNESVNRVYSKMLCDMLRRGAIVLPERQASVPVKKHKCGTAEKVFILSDGQALSVAEKAFDMLLNPETAVAVKVWQIELLHDLSGHIEWIEEQLTEVVRAMSERPDCTPAEAAHARHYFKRLAKKRKSD